jgi:hypothetical protein
MCRVQGPGSMVQGIRNFRGKWVLRGAGGGGVAAREAAGERSPSGGGTRRLNGHQRPRGGSDDAAPEGTSGGVHRGTTYRDERAMERG